MENATKSTAGNQTGEITIMINAENKLKTNMENQVQKIDVSIFSSIEKNYIEQGLSKADFMREASFAVQMFEKNSYLKSATQDSKLRAVYNVALTGTTLNPVLKYAYLVPRRNTTTRDVEACLEISYMGLSKLITDAGSVQSIIANIVYEGDLFDVDLFNPDRQVHKPYYTQGKPKGKIVGCYAYARLKDAMPMYDYMDLAQLYEIRGISESYISYSKKTDDQKKFASCIWIDNETEMMRKTVIKRLCKYLPKTKQFEKVAAAVELDNQEYKSTYGQRMYIDSLLRTSVLTEDQKNEVELSLDTLNFTGAGKMIEYLLQNQVQTVDDHMNSIKHEMEGEMTDKDNEIIEEIMKEVSELKTATEIKANAQEFEKKAGLKGISNAGRAILKNAINAKYLLKVEKKKVVNV